MTEKKKPKRKKKDERDLTTEEAIRKLFPKRAVDEAKKEAHRHDDDEK